MNRFITDAYLLQNRWSQMLYEYAKKQPIIDYHCHLSPKEIYEDKTFRNITEVWLGSDHYKWRLMRSAGIEEKYITGDSSDKEKFLAWARTVSMAIGNPLLEWSHLELKNYFGFDGFLDESTAEEVWDLANEKLKETSARKLIRDSRAEVLCTTDDPIDNLYYHRLMAKEDMGFRVCPAWRPDQVLNIEKDGWKDYIHKLEEVSKVKIDSYVNLLKALENRMDLFAEMGCRTADHGLAHVPCVPCNEEEVNAIFLNRMEGLALSSHETEKFRTALLKDLSVEYCRMGWVSQLHYGVKRDNSSFLLKQIGHDAGGDNISDRASISRICDFLDLLDKEDHLPKTILYSLDPNDNTAIDTIIASFQRGPQVSRIQHGSAWWFNDNYRGMRDQLESLATQGYLAGFVGMLTDSRSFLSYARHEYFRRVLCCFLGELVEQGRYPEDEEKLKKIVEDISYNNVKNYFSF